jgi:CRP/FNR family cyclic AMP-dependent transcriptional regulator
MLQIPNAATFRQTLAGLPVQMYQSGETVLSAGATTGKLLVLKEGVVEVVKDGVQIATVSEPGAVFGEQAILLGKSHTADIRALEPAEFHVADAETLLGSHPTATLYIAAILARRLDGANQALIEVRRQLEAGEPRRIISKTVERVEELLSSSIAASLMYAGYPTDPFAEAAAPA